MSVPDLQPVDAPSPEALDALRPRLLEFRSHFHRFLLEWFRAPTDTEGLAKLGLLFQHLQGVIPDGRLADLFQLAAAYLDILQHGEGAVEAPSQAIMGHLDRVLKPLVTTPPRWPESDIGVLTEAFLVEFSRVGVAPARMAEMGNRRRGSVAAPTESLPTTAEPSAPRPVGASGALSTSDFSLPGPVADQAPTPIPSPLRPIAQARDGMSLAMTEPLVESADRWLEVQTQRSAVADEVDSSPEVAGLPDLGMGWEASGFGSLAGTGVTEEFAPDPFAGLGLVISADELPELLGRPTDSGDDTGAIDAFLADSLAELGALPRVDTLPELNGQTLVSGGDAELTLDALADPLAELDSQSAAGPLPDLLLEPFESGPEAAATEAPTMVPGAELGAETSLQYLDDLLAGLDIEPVAEPLPELFLEPLEPGPEAALSEASSAELVMELGVELGVDLGADLGAELGSVSSLQPLPDLPPLSIPAPSPPASSPATSPATAPLATLDRPAIDGDALTVELNQVFNRLVGSPMDAIGPLPESLRPGGATDESRPTAVAEPLPLPAPSGEMEPMPAPVIGVDPVAEFRSEPVTQTQPATPPASITPGTPITPVTMAAPDLSILSPGVILPPVVETATEPVFPFVGAGTRIEAEPALGVARPQTRPHVHSDSRERTLDMVAEIGLNCARLAQRNGLMGCGLAEYDLTLRHLRQQLRRLESAAEAAIQDPARPGGADKVPRLESGLLGSDRNAPLRQGLQDLAATLAQMVGLRDQLGEYQRESAELLAQQTQLADDLQDGLSNGQTRGDG